MAFVVARPDSPQPDPGAILQALGEHFARWQLPAPGDIRIIPEMPNTSVGKFDKKVLRGGLWD